jgi:hypothetical protein
VAAESKSGQAKIAERERAAVAQREDVKVRLE